jgi:hypothetical protein
MLLLELSIKNSYLSLAKRIGKFAFRYFIALPSITRNQENLAEKIHLIIFIFPVIKSSLSKK